MSTIIKLPESMVMKIHDRQIETYGGIKGIRDDGLFSQLCAAPYQQFAGIELFPTIFEKAAKYIDGFARHQVFLDGNKRTAASTMIVFLMVNGIETTFDNDSLTDLTLDVANDKLPFDEIVESIKTHVRHRFI